MKLSIITLLVVTQASAFQPLGVHHRASSALSYAAEDDMEGGMGPSIDVSATLAKAELLEVAKGLNTEYGCLLIDSGAQAKLREKVENLEAVTDPPEASADLIGDWTLLCSTASASLQSSGPLDRIGGIDTTKLPFYKTSPFKDIRDTVNKSLKVQQIIKAETTPGIISRIDHVLQYQPPDTLSAFMENLPEQIKSLDINPLKVSQSKVSLVHKAEVESITPLKTKLSLSSIVVNVAGKSQILSPEGADVLGINVPFGEFLNAGSFETTYMDDRIRISRSKVAGIVDQLRVFVRSDYMVEAEDVVEEEDGIQDAEIVDSTTSPPDVDDISPSDY